MKNCKIKYFGQNSRISCLLFLRYSQSALSYIQYIGQQMPLIKYNKIRIMKPSSWSVSPLRISASECPLQRVYEQKESQVLAFWVNEHKGSKVGLWSFVVVDSLKMEVRCRNTQGWMRFYDLHFIAFYLMSIVWLIYWNSWPIVNGNLN